jgi:signal transduction histidine kinase
MKKSIHSTVYVPLFFILAFFLILHLGINTYLQYEKFVETKKQIETTILQNQRDSIQSKVDFIVSEIKPTIAEETKRVKEKLREKVEIAHDIATHLYTTNQTNHLNIIKESLRKFRSNNHKSEYLFIVHVDGTLLLYPIKKSLEGKNIFKIGDRKHKETMENISHTLKAKKSGYFEYEWYNHINDKFEKKISFIQYFEPLNAYIGTGVFQSTIDRKLKDKFIENIEKYKHGDNLEKYFFAASYDGLSLTGPGKGTNILQSSNPLAVKLITKIINTAKSGGGFVTYELPLGDGKIIEKLSYVKSIDSWNIYVGTGEELKNIQELLDRKKAELITKLYDNLFVTTAISIIFFIVLYILLNRLENKLNFEITNITNAIELLFTKNEKIDSKTLHFIEFETIANHSNNLLINKNEMEKELKDKEAILFHQSKMATMGEMLENIAHQWRQPLSVISTSSSAVLVKKGMNSLEDTYLIDSMETIIHNTQYLSNTIDDFRDFFKKDKSKEYFDVATIVEQTFALIGSKMKNSNINIIKDMQPIECLGFKNELLQVLLVVLNNARDALEGSDIENKMIFITTFEDEEYIYISILDNANGIKEEYISKIFDAYFTTKGDSDGTGIGLHMANQIIEQHMDGKLIVTNEHYTHNNINQTGAKFTIKLPNIRS